MFKSSALSRRALLLGTAAVATAAALPAVAAIAPPNKILSNKEAFYAYAYGMKVDRIECPGFDAAAMIRDLTTGKWLPPFTVHMSGPNGTVGSFSSTDEAILKMMLNVLKRKQTLTLGIRDAPGTWALSSRTTMSRTPSEPHQYLGQARTHYALTVHLSREHLDRYQRGTLKRAISEVGGLKYAGYRAASTAVCAAIALRSKVPNLVAWVNVSRNTLQSIATVGKY